MCNMGDMNKIMIDGQEIDRADAPIEYDRERFDLHCSELNEMFKKSEELRKESQELRKNMNNIKAVNQAFDLINNLFNF